MLLLGRADPSEGYLVWMGLVGLTLGPVVTAACGPLCKQAPMGELVFVLVCCLEFIPSSFLISPGGFEVTAAPAAEVLTLKRSFTDLCVAASMNSWVRLAEPCLLPVAALLALGIRTGEPLMLTKTLVLLIDLLTVCLGPLVTPEIEGGATRLPFLSGLSNPGFRGERGPLALGWAGGEKRRFDLGWLRLWSGGGFLEEEEEEEEDPPSRNPLPLKGMMFLMS